MKYYFSFVWNVFSLWIYILPFFKPYLINGIAVCLLDNQEKRIREILHTSVVVVTLTKCSFSTCRASAAFILKQYFCRLGSTLLSVALVLATLFIFEGYMMAKCALFNLSCAEFENTIATVGLRLFLEFSCRCKLTHLSRKNSVVATNETVNILNT